MDNAIQRLLNDKLYDRRKQGALELEKIVRDAVFQGEQEKIQKIVEQLCHDYAYAVHQPHARNGGLIGLAAASIALGSEGVAPYLGEIVPPVLACFSDQDARVRYYACESMYNIAKVAKGEILLFFNEIFDALAKLASDSELSVKNGAELLDRLVKDIVAESAASYVSILQLSEKEFPELENQEDQELPMAFSLARFIPLLKDRIHVIQPFTRNFLVSWLTLLDTIPDLELVSYLPEFLEGLIKFLGGPNKDVNIATQGLLDRFLLEIKRITRLKKGIEESRKSQKSNRQSVASDVMSNATGQNDQTDGGSDNKYDTTVADSTSDVTLDDEFTQADGDWIPGQDVQIDHPQILDILVSFVSTSYEEEMQLTALRWLDSFFEISPEDILPFVPQLLTQVLPAMSSGSDQVRKAANQVNTSLVQYIYSLSDDTIEEPQMPPLKVPSVATSKEIIERRSSTPGARPSETASIDARKQTAQDNSVAATPRSSVVSTPVPPADLDYAAAVNSLTLQFLNENEATRVAALVWLIMLHRKAPRKVVAFNDGTFPALLKTLSDPSEAVVTKDLQLLSQISRNSEDSYFTSFMINLLQLYSTDRHLLEVRGNLIIRQLSLNLSPERIYRTLADCLEKEEDLEFASIMVQNLNNNLITAPELSELRKRLRNLDSKDGQMFFVGLFRSWCHNAVSTFSLCLLAQAYEQAYNLLQIFAELEMTVNMLIQIDKLVQLLESPVFTYLRLQLLEPEKYPFLYKCLYGVLMLLPQSSAFAALKNRLNSVGNIGFLHGASRSTTQTVPSFDRSGTRLKTRDESSIRWVELLEKFKSVQERARRSQVSTRHSFDQSGPMGNPSLTAALSVAAADRPKDRSGLPDAPRGAPGHSNSGAGNSGLGGHGTGGTAAGRALDSSAAKTGPSHKHKSSLPNLGRLGIGGRKSKK
ncbi:Vacuole-associated enzyme activator complex component (Vac14), putative [Penicillium digitatum]|uniref:Vacuole-associated enzyme activator complex component (Vac14), putative n=2 Tax=Penicillium digitatum TaxID=36651 RepID=K9FWQ9_PEND1|nr:Vacuole-associated enzyme activator complex component (Vac14), putative [Penicillium digitatum Pd1]EKV14095.1 Vacuole-associated enzyme activator complex component (Vac14), putative [Penicillium digitatum Pd1]QQK46191.1 Vacuole-associated enzyme activator complex component (Vac14), putative [Penicillium digitatum]